MDILLDENHDIFFDGKDISLTTSKDESLRQRLRIKLLTFLGEWFLDPSIGIDYYGSVFGKNRSKEAIDSIFQKAILEEESVKAISSFSSHIDKTSRVYTLKFEVVSDTSGEPIPINLNVGKSLWLD